MRQLLLICFLLLPCLAFSAITGKEIALEKVRVDPNNKASVLRGAKFFAANCMVCHTMRYLKYNKIAKQAGITLDKMPLKQKEWYLGITPPDLTLIARQRSPAWLYTYFHSFYKDPSRPTGYNNLLITNNMINVFAPMQGQQELTASGEKALSQATTFSKPHYYSVLELIKSGSMSPEEFNQSMTDLVNFLVYASDPERHTHQYIGYWVISFLILLAILAYILKRLYWKQVK